MRTSDLCRPPHSGGVQHLFLSMLAGYWYAPIQSASRPPSIHPVDSHAQIREICAYFGAVK